MEKIGVKESTKKSTTKKASSKVKEAKKDQPKPKKTVAKSAQPSKVAKPKKDSKPGYFKGAWQELQQVRWPDRRASWSLTLAVILFSLFFAGLILGLDYIFENLFRKVIL